VSEITLSYLERSKNRVDRHMMQASIAILRSDDRITDTHIVVVITHCVGGPSPLLFSELKAEWAMCGMRPAGLGKIA
jgi:hypothetical protein